MVEPESSETAWPGSPFEGMAISGDANMREAQEAIMAKKKDEMIWSYLLHLSYNMWVDHDIENPRTPHIVARDYLRFDVDLYKRMVNAMHEGGINQIIFDVGDAVKFDSHPEIAVKRAWSPKRMRQEVEHLRKLGIEAIPKLNFSACHDEWLKQYSRMLSTDTYYGVVKDLIAETIDIFDKPRFFHIGMDEETAAHQRNLQYAVIRQFDLWWKDLFFYIDQVEKGGSRAWVWSDYVWHHPDTFYKRMPKSVLQSNWYYRKSFSQKIDYVKAYVDLEEKKYDQVPTGSNWSCDSNFEGTVKFCTKHIADKRLLGFMHAPWYPTLPDVAQEHMNAIAQMRRAKAWYEKQK